MKQINVLQKSTSLSALVIAVLLLSAASGWADSRSATIRISCTVVPMIEMKQGAAWSGRSNLDHRYFQSEDLIKRDGTNVRLVSITAL